jgi:hypothetical protein
MPKNKNSVRSLSSKPRGMEFWDFVKLGSIACIYLEDIFLTRAPLIQLQEKERTQPNEASS